MKLLWLAALLFAGLACAPSPSPSAGTEPKLDPSAPLSEPMTREYRACSTDADCVVALNGCCDCANGGEDIAVHRDKLASFQARFQCSGACTEMGGECARGTAHCEAELCTYREPADGVVND